jgi:hypothetical protein
MASGDAAEPASKEAAPEIAMRLLEARVEFVDASSGATVPGAAFDDETAPIHGGAWAYDVRRAVPVVEFHALPGPSPLASSADLGRTSWARRAVRMPEGYVVFERPLADQPIAGHARSLRTVQSLHRELSVRVTFVDERDRPVSGARVVAWQVGDVVVGEPVVEPNSDGSLRLRGVPWVPGASLRLGCARLPPEPSADGAMHPFSISIGDPSETESVDSPFRWNMPESPREAIEARIPVAALAVEDLRAHMQIDWDQAAVDVEAGAPDTLGSARVEVLDAAGRPLPFVPVFVDGASVVTGKDGVATFAALRAGAHGVALRELGRLFAATTVDVTAGRESKVALREIDGATLEVVVIDAAGDTVPFARLRVVTASKLPWLDLDAAGVQRLDPFTDGNGRRTLSRVEPGLVTVYASYGDGHAKAEVDLLDGQRKALRLELK